jgi:hypothetical protein
VLQRPPCELTFELLNARVQTIDLGPVTARWSRGQRLVLNLGEIDGDAQLSIIAEHSRQQKASRSLLTGVGSLERHFGLKQ